MDTLNTQKRMNKSWIIALICIGTLTISSCNSSTQSTEKEVDPSIADNNKTASNPDAQNPEPMFKFVHDQWDFGKINEGEEVKHIYRFTNVGNEELVISNVRATCGCTVPRWDRKPIAPGESGEIEVKFNSKNKPGNQIKNCDHNCQYQPTRNNTYLLKPSFTK